MASRENKRQASTSSRLVTRRSTLKGGVALGAGLTAGTFGIIGRASAAPVTMRFGSDSPVGAAHPKAGTLDSVVTDVTYISTAVPEADVFNLPFLYTDTTQVLRFANGQVGERLKPKISEAFGCEVLGFATDGSRNLWNSKRPIRTPADIEGLKMGVQPSKIQRDTILAFGGIPTVVAFNALYTALQTGLVDGSDKAFADMMELKFYQVTKYLTLTSHFSIVNVLIVSKKFMDKLSPQDREVVDRK